ncbi:YqjF family protein [Isoptericola variabilis]|nr:DUF2071 domain-containing protein [Isoptericola variabilis]TWH33793.1 hypothetical protein L600_001500000040 [Isoptericola variabilis J7]
MSGRHPDERVRRAVSLQRWERIAFVHWRYRPEVLRPVVPPGLDLQLVDGSAWVAMTPFVMARMRAPGLPPVPGWSTFPEVNLRTYVSDGRRDGVLFLRVLCARRLVVGAFRAGLGLPYVHASGSVASDRTEATYEVGETRAHVVVGPAELPDPVVDSLTGRWNAFTRHLGRLWRVPVEHPPWMLHRARLDRLHTDLLADVGLPAPDDLPLVHWSPGVDVRLGAPRLVPD